MPQSANFRASIFMLLAMGTFTIGDTITKYLLTEMNSGQYMLIRGIFATVLIGLLAWRHGALRNLSLEKMTILRVVGEVVATITYIYSLGHLSQAFCSAVFQATPRSGFSVERQAASRRPRPMPRGLNRRATNSVRQSGSI